MKNTFLLIAVVLFSSCGQQKQRQIINSIIKDTISIDIENAKRYNISEIVDTIYLVPLENTGDIIMGKIGKVILTSDTLFIYDESTKDISLFTVSGKYIRKINKLGRGPGEYDNIRDFCIDEKEREIVVLSSTKILKYDYSGKNISESKLTSTGDKMECLENGYLVVYGVSHNLLIYDEKIRLRDKYFPDKKLSVPLHPFSSNNGNIYYHREFDSNIYKVSLEGIFIEKYLDFGNRTPCIELMEKLNMKGSFGQPLLPDSYVSLTNFHEFDKGYVIRFQCVEKNSSYVALIDKSDGQTKVIKGLDNKDHIFPFPSPKFKSNSGDLLIYPLNAYDIKNLMELNNKKSEAETQDILQKDNFAIYSSIPPGFSENDNPVLMFFTYKFN